MVVRITLFEAEQYDDKFPSSNAVEFNQWLTKIISDVPNEHQKNIKIYIDTEADHYPSYSEIEIYYYRDETEAEIKERQDKKRRLEEINLEDKRKLLDKLKLELGEV